MPWTTREGLEDRLDVELARRSLDEPGSISLDALRDYLGLHPKRSSICPHKG
ncbi:MAG TPA: hypothetical protein PK668_14805 [Myxococcota bacterium]|nr:hypothetical protein [Myxococcota bacterium]HRY93865.1 hypothetical protein [Myxococcota bacterium]HSA23680.1 hypothetical protein [Myxococcota bacterium]